MKAVPDYVSVLREAKAVVRASPLYPQFIAGTPLENDIAVWMADFARSYLRREPPPATRGRCRAPHPVLSIVRCGRYAGHVGLHRALGDTWDGEWIPPDPPASAP